MPASGLPYRWSQTEAEVTVELDLPTGGCGPVGRRLGGRDVRCLIGAHELRLAIEGVGVVLDGATGGCVDPAESSWSVEHVGRHAPKKLVISLAKNFSRVGGSATPHWAALLDGEEVRAERLAATTDLDDRASEVGSVTSESPASALPDDFLAAPSFHPTGKRPAIRLVDTQRRPSQMGELINSARDAKLASLAFCERIMQRTKVRLGNGRDRRGQPLPAPAADAEARAAAGHDACEGGQNGAVPPLGEGSVANGTPDDGGADEAFIFRALELANTWPGSRRGDHSAGLAKSVQLRTGIRMAYSEWGELRVDRRRGGPGEKQTLVLLHGAGECRQVWSRMAWHLTGDERALDLDHLLMSWYHVIAIDMRGHGGTTGGRQGPVHIDELVEDLEAFAEALELNADREETRQYCLIGGIRDDLLRDASSIYQAHWSVAGVGLGAAVAAAYAGKQTRRDIRGGFARGRVRSAALVEFEPDAPSSVVRYCPVQAARFNSRVEAAQFLYEASSRTTTPEAIAPLLAHALVRDPDAAEGDAVFRFRTPDDFFVSGVTAGAMRAALRSAKRGCDAHALLSGMPLPERLQRIDEDTGLPVKRREVELKGEHSLAGDVFECWGGFKELARMLDYRLCTRFRAEREQRENNYRANFTGAKAPDCRLPTSDVGWSINALQDRSGVN